MTKPRPDRDDEAFLAAFAERHREPRARDVFAAQKLWPHLAAEIRDVAIKLNEAAFNERILTDNVADEADIRSACSALDSAAADADPSDLADLIAFAGMTAAALAETITLPLKSLRKITEGRFRPPLSGYAVATLSDRLRVAPATLAAAALSISSASIFTPRWMIVSLMRPARYSSPSCR